MRRATLLALLVVALAPTGAHADPCDDSLRPDHCDYSRSTVPAPAGGRMVTVTIPIHDTPEARELYASVLRAPYSMPDEPLVAVQILEAEFPMRGPDEFGPGRFMEGPISLRAKRPNGEEAWFHVSEPMVGDYTYSSGRDVGLPKEYATMSLRPEGDGWIGAASIGERSISRLHWQPADVDVPAVGLRWTRMLDPFLSVMPALAAPDERTATYITKFTLKPPVFARDLHYGTPADGLPTGVAPVTALPEPQSGLVSYRLDPDLNTHDTQAPGTPLPDLFPVGTSLADLIEVEGVAPGHFWRVDNGFALIQTQQTPDHDA